ncbi:hypothetical protein F4818DRAFT_443146 [Hypoxylon cercidicola]|nr:hypothetical protein F4818DRAFT_443146 [Hypoxylon cercidicola]
MKPSTSERPLGRRTLDGSAPKLALVTVTHPDQIKDRTLQRTIHNHVMRDIGASRRRAPRRAQATLNVPSDFDSERALYRRVGHQDDPHTGPWQLISNIPQSLPSVPGFGLQIDSARAQRLLSYLKRGDVPVCQVLRKICFTLAMTDDSAMSLAQAYSVLYLEPSNQKPFLRESVNALEHYTVSLRLVNEQLTKITGAGWDGVITTVVGLAAYDLGLRKFERWAIHMTGLKKMIQDRGGSMEGISSYHVRMIMTWTELVGSLSLDSPPQFPSPVIPTGRMPVYTASPAMARTLSTLQRRFTQLSDICEVLQSLSGMTQMFSGQQLGYWEGDTSEALSLVVSNALTVPRLALPQDPTDDSAAGLVMREAIRLASLLFLATPVDLYAANAGIAQNLRGRLPKLLRSWVLDWRDLEELEFWILVVDALVEVGEERTWAVSQVHRIMQKRGLNCEDILFELRQFAWFDGILVDELDGLRAEVNMLRDVR